MDESQPVEALGVQLQVKTIACRNTGGDMPAAAGWRSQAMKIALYRNLGRLSESESAHSSVEEETL
jgi:hypothetical protein